jgi:hypothetical protein
MFFEDCLRLLGGFDHFFGLVAFKARELHNRHMEFLPNIVCYPSSTPSNRSRM